MCNIPCPQPFDNSGVAVQYGIPVAVVSLSVSAWKVYAGEQGFWIRACCGLDPA